MRGIIAALLVATLGPALGVYLAKRKLKRGAAAVQAAQDARRKAGPKGNARYHDKAVGTPNTSVTPMRSDETSPSPSGSTPAMAYALMGSHATAGQSDGCARTERSDSMRQSDDSDRGACGSSDTGSSTSSSSTDSSPSSDYSL